MRSDRVVRNRDGFTLIELLVVVIVLGMLAMIASAGFSHARTRAFIAGMQQDLRLLSIQEELYYGRLTASGYTNDLTYLPFQVTPGVVLTITNATRTGWAAQASHRSVSSAMCGIFMGTAPASSATPAIKQGEIECTY